jgi:hypothetical protein
MQVRPAEKRLFTASRLLGKLAMGCALTDLQASRGDGGNQNTEIKVGSKKATRALPPSL